MDGFEIPIGGDFAPFQAAIDRVVAAVDRMSAQITAALEKSSAATARATSGMQRHAQANSAVATAAAAAGAASASTTARFIAAAAAAGNFGQGVGGLVSGLQFARRAAQALAATNLGARIGAWISSAGGLRGALARIPEAMRAIASSPAFRMVAVGAVAAIAGVVALRVAFRTAALATRVLSTAASATFRAVIASAQAASRAVATAFRGISSMPGRLMGAMPMLPIAGVLSMAGAVALMTTQLRAASTAAGGMEMMETQFQVMLGSVSKATAMIAGLRKEAMASPLGLGDFTKSAQTLMQFGVEEQKVINYTKMLSEVSMGNSERFQSLSLAFSQISATGRLMGQDLLQLINAGFNPLQQISMMTGESMVSLKKRMEDGKVSFDEIIGAFTAATGAGGRFFQMNERAAGTFQGKIAMMRDAWQQLQLAIGKPLNDALKPIMDSGVARMTAMLETAKRLGEQIAGSLRVVFAAFQSGRTLEFVGKGLNFAFHKAVDLLLRGLRGAVGFLAAALPPIFDSALARISDPQFWQGIALLLTSAGHAFAAEIQQSFGRSDAARRSRLYSQLDQGSGAKMIEAAGGRDIGDDIAKALQEGVRGFKIGADGPESEGLKAASAAMENLINVLKFGVAKSLPAIKEIPSMPVAPAVADFAKQEGLVAQLAPLVTSLGRIGGGGGLFSGSNPMVSKQSETNSLLRDIRSVLKSSPPAFAVIV